MFPASGDRALAPPGMFGDEPSEIPWVIVDGAWAKPDMPLLAQLRNLGVQVLVDSQSWRFADERTWEVAKYATLEHRPSEPLDLDDTDALAAFVKADLEWQLTLGADALLLPGLMPQKDDDGAIRGLTLATEVAMTSNLTHGRPIVGFLGGHSRSIDLVNAVAEDSVIALLSAACIQISPVNPMTDPTSKLIDVIETMVRFERNGTPVVSGHLGALGGVLRALGVSAADASLGTGETFDAKRLLRPRARQESGPGGRADRFAAVRDADTEIAGPEAVGRADVDRCDESVPRLPSDVLRFRPPQARAEWARKHSLRSRVAEALDLAGLAPSMRASREVDVLQAARASLVTVNSSLQSNGHETLPVEHVANQLAALQRILAGHRAA